MCCRLRNCIDPSGAIVTTSRDILIIPFFVRARACNAEEIKGLPVAPVLYPRLVIQRDYARGLENPMNSLFPCLRFSDVLSHNHPLSLSLCLSSLIPSLTSSFSLFPFASLVTATRARTAWSGSSLAALRDCLPFVVLCGPCPTIPGLNCNYLYCERGLPRLRRCAIQNNEELMIFGSEGARGSTRDAILRQPPVSQVGGALSRSSFLVGEATTRRKW